MTSTPPATTPVDRVEVAPRAWALLEGADYGDAFRVAADGPHPAEAWARRTFEAGPEAGRRVFGLLAWRGALGMRLGPSDVPGFVAGWTIDTNEPGRIVLRVASPLVGAVLAVEADDTHATLTTLLRFDRPRARLTWKAEGVAHRALAPVVLGGAARSLARRAARGQAVPA